MKRILWLCSIACALLLVGCKGRESQLIGTWKADIGNQVLTLKDDKTFSISLPMGSATMDGKWRLDGSTAKLATETVGGKSKAEAIKQLTDLEAKMPAAKSALEASKKQLDEIDLEVAADNKKMTTQVPGPSGAPMTVTFTKS